MQQLMMQQLLMQQQMLKAQGINLDGVSSDKHSPSDKYSPPEKPYVTNNTDLTVASPEEQPYKTNRPKAPHIESPSKIKAIYNNMVPVVNELIQIGSNDSAKNIIDSLVQEIQNDSTYKNGDNEVKQIINNLHTASKSLSDIVEDDT
jgi:hypothetical protein